MRLPMLVAAAIFMAAPGAHAAIVTFESFTAGQPVDSITFSDGTTATVTTVSNRPAAQGGTNQGVVFDTRNPTGNDADLGGPFASASGGPALDPGNILIINGPDSGLGLPDDDALGGTITFTFSRVVDLLSFNFFDTEADQNNGLVVTTDTGGNSGPLFTGDNEYDIFSTPFRGITSATFAFGGSGGIDDLKIGVIPVPASLPLLASALLLLGFLRRRRTA